MPFKVIILKLIFFFFACNSCLGDEVLDIDKGELEDAKWFPIEDIKRSLFDIKKDPLKVMQKQEFFVPPRGTVAHSLIDSWISQLTS